MSGLFGGAASIVSPAATAIQVQSSCNGVPIAIIYGRTRFAGNITWYGDFLPIAQKTSSGGKGGGATQTTWTYTCSFSMALCEGPIAAVPSMWQNGTKTTPVDPTIFTLHTGSYSQPTWAYMDSLHAAQSLNYPGLAYQSAANYNLSTSASLPALSWEIQGFFANVSFNYAGANPKDIIFDLVTNPHYGAAFASSKIFDLTAYQNYCGAMGLFLSPCYDTQASLAQMLTDIVQLTNTGVYFSEGLLKLVPYGDTAETGFGYTFTPPTSTLINLGDDDFIVDSPDDDPVQVLRNAIPTTANTSADAFNQVTLEYLNNLNGYNPELCPLQDQASVDQFGLIPMDTITAHQITDPTAANTACSLILQRAVYIRNQYIFRLGWNYAFLEPTDIVTITDSTLGLILKPVRLLIVEEDEAGTLTITAEDAPPGASSRVVATPATGAGYSVNGAIAPGNTFPPAFFEPPVQNVSGTSGVSVWLGATGVPGATSWGGANVWASNDGNSYSQIGTVTTPGRVGHLTAAITSGATSGLAIQLDGLGGTIVSGSAADAANMTTLLCILGANPEFIAYQGATLTGANAYTLGGLVRGCYSSTVAAHNIGDVVVRVDGAILQGAALDTSMIGKTLYFKFCSFNIFGAATQNLADVPAYQYTVTGSALKAPLGNVAGVSSFFRSNNLVLSWQKVTDPVRTVDYEVRVGATWPTALVLGRTNNLEFNCQGGGTYWIAAHSAFAYSAAPVAVVVAGSTLVKNVVAAWDEQATSWAGSVSGGAIVQGGSVVLTGGALSGEYAIPSGHEVDIGTVQACNCSIAYVARADNPNALFSAVPLVSALPSLMGNYAGLAGVQIQIATSDLSGTYCAWSNFLPGQYLGRKFKFKAILTSTVSSIIAALDAFAFTVDMPDRVDKGTNLSVVAGGQAVAYGTAFQVAPNVQVTIINATAGDDIVLTAQATGGFTIQVKNGGVGVARVINWLAQGY